MRALGMLRFTTGRPGYRECLYGMPDWRGGARGFRGLRLLQEAGGPVIDLFGEC
jgi:hypothetical protein